MKYTLMHKNHRTLDVEIDTDSSGIVAAGDVYCVERIPVGSIRDGKAELQELKAWWSHRSIPISRSGIDKALETMGIGTTSELLTKCMGLSLSDTYWVRPESSDLAWENVNFFDNDFSDDVGNNCAEIAGKSWNDDIDFRVWISIPTPAVLKKSIKKRSESYKINFHSDEWTKYINREVVNW